MQSRHPRQLAAIMEVMTATAPRRLSVVRPPPIPQGQPVTRPDCRCGHPAAEHDHYRPGTDCSGYTVATPRTRWLRRCDCPRYRPTLRQRLTALLYR